MIIKKILVFLWNKMIDSRNNSINKSLIIKDGLRKYFYKPPSIKSIDDTLDEIVKKKVSVCRYGDGEFKLIQNKNITFQKASERLSNRLKEILLCRESDFIVCLPDVFEDLSPYVEETVNYWRLHNAKFRIKWYQLIDKNKDYYNSFISRFYYPFKDKSKCNHWLVKLKLIWKDKDIVLIEGSKSRLGIGNDLFDNTKSIERILVPEENAFLIYDKILEEAKKIDKSKLILLAAGPTATVLAYDLFKLGYQAIDIGHVDIEYEWFLRKAKNKIRIENKYVCEAGAGTGVGDLQDINYLKQITARIS